MERHLAPSARLGPPALLEPLVPLLCDDDAGEGLVGHDVAPPQRGALGHPRAGEGEQRVEHPAIIGGGAVADEHLDVAPRHAPPRGRHRVGVHAGGWLLDGDGVTRPENMQRRWRERERVRLARVEPRYVLPTADEESALCPTGVIFAIGESLRSALGAVSEYPSISLPTDR